MLRRQGLPFELMPNGQPTGHLRQFAESCRSVYNKALALNTQRYEKKEKLLGYAELCALLPGWKREHPFLSDVPAQQALEKPRTGVHQLLRKASRLSEVQEERESFRIPQGFALDSQNGRVEVPKMGWMRYRKSQEVLGEAKNLTLRESCRLGCQPVRVASPTGIQNAVARRSAGPGSAPKHQPQVSRVWAGSGGDPQVTSQVRLRPVRILGPCGFPRCREY
jgi:hypothetical protein